MPSPTLQLLIQIQSNLTQLNQTITGLQNLTTAAKQVQQVSLGWGDAFKFAGAKEALDGVVEGLKKVGEAMVEVVKGAVEQAGLIQAEEFPLTVMLRDAGNTAREILEGMNSLWQRSGQVSSEALSNTARSLVLIGVPLENVTSQLTELSKISAGSGLQLDDLGSAFARLRQAITNNIEPAIRGMGGFGAATAQLVDILAEHFGKTREAVLQMFKSGQVSFQDLNNAMREATEGGGIFANAFEEKRKIFEGSVSNLNIAWKGFETELGKPIIDVLTPIFNRWADRLREAGDTGSSLGDKIANAISKVDDTLENLDVKAILQQKWQEALDAIADVIDERTNQLWIDVFETIPKQEWAAFTSWWGPASKVTWTQVIEETKTLWAGFWDWLKQQTDEARDYMEHHGVPSLPSQLVTPAPQNLPPPELGPSDMIPTPVEGEPVEETTQKVDAAKQLATAMHELEAAISAVHQQQNLINAQPFTLVDQKNTQLLQSYAKEILDLQDSIKKLQALKSAGILNEPQTAEAVAQIVKAQNQVDILRQKITGLVNPLRTELTSWANSFGSTAQQIGKAIEGSIGVALQSVNQFLVTGKFNAQQLMQQIVLLGLQLVEQLIIQRVMAAINASAAVAQATAQGPLIAAALSPAVTAATIATEGTAAALAPGEVAAASAAILGILSGPRLHAGGLAPGEVPIIAEEGEVMIRRSVAQQPGMLDYLLALNAGEFHWGGRIRRMHGGGHTFNPDYPDFDDPREFGGTPSWYTPKSGQGPIETPPPWIPPDHIEQPPPDSPGPGPIVETPNARDFVDEDYGDTRTSLWLNRMYAGFGTSPTTGLPAFGPTMLNTNWYNYPGVGLVPMAIPVTPDVPWNRVTEHLPHKSASHTGGLIRRFHGGGSVGAGSGGGTGVHIYAFTDLKQLTKHMSSRDGQKIIFDTVKGRRIDLGLK